MSGGVSNIRDVRQRCISQRLTARRNNLTRGRLPTGGSPHGDAVRQLADDKRAIPRQDSERMSREPSHGDTGSG